MNKLPTIKQLSKSDISEEDKGSTLQVLLNHNPPSEFVKTHPSTSTNYIPVEMVEMMMTKVFGHWSVEIKDYKLIANSVCVTVRLHYKDPMTGESLFQDGAGASPLQTNKGAHATDFTALKNSSVQMALPSAESYAFKDAAEKIGKLFGKDLNRKAYTDYQDMVPASVKEYDFKNLKLTEK